ncbi:MAG: alpha/beta hydrolase [Candidatus Obscuribacterales bacterium]|nr:alpha/beta hydrolase [Candidatus Obscuribacterales bacterium]
MSYSDHIRDGLQLRLNDGRRLAFAEYGKGNGEPLLYFHGGISSRQDIAFAAEFCAKNSIRIIAPDRPGTGLSDPLPGRSLLSWVKDVEQLLDALEIEKLPLLGWSLGGPYVLICAQKLSPRIMRAGTIGSAGPLNESDKIDELGLLIDRWLLKCPRQIQWLPGSLLQAAASLPPKLLHLMMINELSAKADREILAKQNPKESVANFNDSIKQGYQSIFDDYLAIKESWEIDLHKIDIEVHLWHGSDDSLSPISAAHFLKNTIPKARLEIVPEQGHFLLHNHLLQVISTMMNRSDLKH